MPNRVMGKQRPRGEKTYTEEEKRLMLKLFKEGMNSTQIARHFPHRTLQSIRAKCQSMGLTIPKSKY